MLGGKCMRIVLEPIAIPLHPPPAYPQRPFRNCKVLPRPVVSCIQFPHSRQQERIDCGERHAFLFARSLFLREQIGRLGRTQLRLPEQVVEDVSPCLQLLSVTGLAEQQRTRHTHGR